MIPKLFWQSAIPKYHWLNIHVNVFSCVLKSILHIISIEKTLLKYIHVYHGMSIWKYDSNLCIFHFYRNSPLLTVYSYTQPYLLTPCSWWPFWPSSVVTDPGVWTASGDFSWGRGSWQYYHAWFFSYRSNNICAYISKGVGNAKQTEKIVMYMYVYQFDFNK